MNASARLQLVRDRFIAGQMECSLRRHLDGAGHSYPGYCGQMPCVGESCRRHGQLESLPQPRATSGGLPGGG